MIPPSGLHSIFLLAAVGGINYLAETPTVVSGESLIPLGVVALLILAVFRAGKEVQKLVSQLDAMEKRQAALEKKLEEHLEEMERAS